MTISPIVRKRKAVVIEDQQLLGRRKAAVDQEAEAAQRRVVGRDERPTREEDAIDRVDLDAAHRHRRHSPDIDDRPEARTIGGERHFVVRAVIDTIQHRGLLGDHGPEAEAADELVDLFSELLVRRCELAPSSSIAPSVGIHEALEQ